MRFSSILLIPMLFLMVKPGSARVYLTKDDVLKQTFPEAESIERRDLILSEGAVKQVQELSKVNVESRLQTYYTARDREGIIGYAFFGTCVIRTKQAVYMLSINKDGIIKNVEILSFYEPEEYLPPRRWFEQFIGRVLDDRLWPKRDIAAVSGATLSVSGITREVRKILAIFQIMIR